jgi:uncharacterized protein YijF (DUF1287 family)
MGVVAEGREGGEAAEKPGHKEGKHPRRSLARSEGTEETTDGEAAEEVAGEDAGREAVERTIRGKPGDPRAERPAGHSSQSASEKNPKRRVHGRSQAEKPDPGNGEMESTNGATPRHARVAGPQAAKPTPFHGIRRFQNKDPGELSLLLAMNRNHLAVGALLALALHPSPLAGQVRTGTAIVAAARSQIGETKTYDPAYTTLGYPGGDVAKDRGVCTDVVIRALRKSLRADLQKLVHEDMRRHFAAYPRNWGLARPDPNIDHRRVPNLQTYFTRRGMSRQIGKTAADFLPGDLITCTVPPRLPHIMIVSDRTRADGAPLVIHNIGRGTVEEDRLFSFPRTGHYRWK